MEKRKIALVEDEQLVCDALSLYLRIDGHEVFTADSLAELLQILDDGLTGLDLVITDYLLGPDEFGSEVIEAVRERFGAGTPAIVLTGDASAVPSQIVDRDGVLLLNKPIDARDLTRMVRELLNTRTQNLSASGSV